LDLLTAAVKGIGLGLSIAVPFGPVNAEVIRRGVAETPRIGLGVAVGASIVDGLCIVGALVGLEQLVRLRGFQFVTAIAGGGLLLWMGCGALRDGLRRWRERDLAVGGNLGERMDAAGASRSFWRAALFGAGIHAANPVTFLFWTTVPSRVFGHSDLTLRDVMVVSAATVFGIFLWLATLTLIVAEGRRFLTPRLMAGVTIAGALALLGYGAACAWGIVELLRGAGAAPAP
jgi:threonine/homoserine/homoserine lactone efflux protein